MSVTGESDPVNPSDWTVDILNSSFCSVPLSEQGCFSKKEVRLRKYDMKMCSLIGVDDGSQ